MPGARTPSPPLALTMGEPGGVGPDITVTAWANRRALGLPPFYVIADPAVLAARAKALGIACPIDEVEPGGAVAEFERALPVVPLGMRVTEATGTADPKNAPAVIEAIRGAVEATRTGSAAAVVTNPIQKASLTAAGFPHPGHTEFLAELAATKGGPTPRAVMMLAGPRLRTVPVTVHIPLAAVPGALTVALIVETGRIVAGDLRARFGIAAPRLAVAGLNPHAGEAGTIGREDEEIVRPAVAALVRAGIAAFGPVPADTLFRETALATYDAALCMYHDQALIPVKTLAFAETVNVTLGLPFVRTSPDHGTALDIAGSGKADAANLVAALKLAAALAARAGGMSQIDDLPPLRDVIARHDLAAKKSLGQNFLLDLNLTARIARAAGDLTGVTVVEVGPGPGGLTRALLAAGAKRVVAIERDRRCIAALEEIAAHYPGRLTIVADDALTVDMAALAEAPARVVANLPYNIATPLLIGWLKAEPWPPWYQSLTLMFQREVAERIAAPPGNRTYGRLSVLTQWRTEARLLFDIPPRAFTPPPKVTSSVVQLMPRGVPLPAEAATLERVTAAAFGQRRKMLRQSLASLGIDTPALLASAGIDGTRRAEQLTVAEFVTLAREAQTASRE